MKSRPLSPSSGRVVGGLCGGVPGPVIVRDSRPLPSPTPPSTSPSPPPASSSSKGEKERSGGVPGPVISESDGSGVVLRGLSGGSGEGGGGCPCPAVPSIPVCVGGADEERDLAGVRGAEEDMEVFEVVESGVDAPPTAPLSPPSTPFPRPLPCLGTRAPEGS